MNIQTYINQLNTRFRTGISTEHTYRGDLQALLTDLCDNILVTNEPTRSACGAPDYILTRRGIPIGYIEAKDIGTDLIDKKYKEQFDRYKSALPNLIFTNYLDFRLYLDGNFKYSISIGHIKNGKIIGNPEKYDEFTDFINNFSAYTGQTIKSSKKLAGMMAAKARLLANIIEAAIVNDEAEETSVADNTLREQLHAFKDVLIHDIKPKDFADIYAQTIAYGMFAARLHDPDLNTFSRQEAAELIPKSNPFLRKLFQYIAGYDLDDRIKWIVDALADIFRATNVAELLKDFGKSTQQNDPMIHFYETFLGEYDPKLRKSRGVWYTPEPVVNFIVRAVDDILKTEFDLKDGLADTTKTKITVDSQVPDFRSKTGRKKAEHEVHKVQILDPAAGTGTFLAEVVKQIYKKFEGQQGIWSKYLEKDLIPRLNGFEILMASYAMAHLKLDILFEETGYKPKTDQRLRVYLTNSLEEHHPDTGLMFSLFLSQEANEANHIKRDTPVMVVVGNPPYAGESQNKGKWITDLISDYKKEPGTTHKLKEKNYKFINNDYVKFIRYAQKLLEKNSSGVLAFINPHGYLSDPTFRGMRWNLLNAFDKIYTIDLHGSMYPKEYSPDGSIDENVFDIKQGVSINIFIKYSNANNKHAEVFHYDCFGKRNIKYSFLKNYCLKSIPFVSVKPKSPDYLFVNRDSKKKEKYDSGFLINELFPQQSLGLLTKRDNLSIDFTEKELSEKIAYFLNPGNDINTVCNRFGLKVTDNDKWNAIVSRKGIQINKINDFIKSCAYRPFDKRVVCYNNKLVARMNTRILSNLNDENNIALIIGRQGKAVGGDTWNVAFITNILPDQNIFSRGGGTVFPLYIYNGTNKGDTISSFNKTPNFNKTIINSIYEILNGYVEPTSIVDYIYAILFSPYFRNTYNEFFKENFPRIPYPKNKKTFWKFVELGSQLREIHLLESPVVDQFITTYPIDGNNEITRKITSKSPGYEPTSKTKGRVWINDQQYFDGVPLVAWEFYIGGYQPAQKWLKDRQGRKLDYDDIRHYQRIIVALNETDRLMKEIDKVRFE